MRFITLAAMKVITLANAILCVCWRVLLFFIDLIDGNDDEADEAPTDHTIQYNHRSADIDPVKRIDGLYDNFRE